MSVASYVPFLYTVRAYLRLQPADEPGGLAARAKPVREETLRVPTLAQRRTRHPAPHNPKCAYYSEPGPPESGQLRLTVIGHETCHACVVIGGNGQLDRLEEAKSHFVLFLGCLQKSVVITGGSGKLRRTVAARCSENPVRRASTVNLSSTFTNQ